MRTHGPVTRKVKTMKQTYDGYVAALDRQERILTVNKERLIKARREHDCKETIRLNRLILLLMEERKELKATITEIKKWLDVYD